MTVLLLLVTLGVHALLQSLACDFADGCSAGEVGALYLLWLIPLGYVLAVFGVRRRQPSTPEGTAEPRWPWAITAGLIALSILVATCFAVAFQ
jgi:hypothetical protein